MLRTGYRISFSSPLPLSGSHPHAQLFPFFYQGEGTSGGSSFTPGEGSGRACPSVSRLLQPSLCGLEDLRLVEACLRSFTPEPSCHPNSVQDGDQPVSTPCNTEGRLDGLHRLEGCLPSNPGASRFSPFSSFCGVRYPIPNQGAMFWSLHSSLSLHSGHGSGFHYASSSGDSDAPLPRSLVGPSVISDQCRVDEGHDALPLSLPLDLGQPGQVSSCSGLVCNLLSNVDFDFNFDGFRF